MLVIIIFSKNTVDVRFFGLNVFRSALKTIEKNWMRLKVRYYRLYRLFDPALSYGVGGLCEDVVLSLSVMTGQRLSLHS